MICLVHDGYGASTTTLVFITCIWVPFLETKQAFFKIISTFMMVFHPQRHHDNDYDYLNVYPDFYQLSALRFNDVAAKEAASRVVDDVCSICLVEFTGDDTVSQLDRCHHVFHTSCIQRWLHDDHFTCPICRSNLTDAISCQYFK
ncbi:Zinc finger, RING/FYVE/PHD-type [Cynara cardunculus var. scolymus]|uniref:Zinc finger, RING/FYVE/PHD-type n=1 Tax=Cynara cardunculus var. scolymus TaxID=59895 RepID=A0A103YE43_CYNCS|nr:Zinc finger, RING/FYVE/PHD-type [Cynara cardunculus var. scolymus]